VVDSWPFQEGLSGISAGPGSMRPSRQQQCPHGIMAQRSPPRWMHNHGQHGDCRHYPGLPGNVEESLLRRVSGRRSKGHQGQKRRSNDSPLAWHRAEQDVRTQSHVSKKKNYRPMRNPHQIFESNRSFRCTTAQQEWSLLHFIGHHHSITNNAA
jgi:hypothetical protein